MPQYTTSLNIMFAYKYICACKYFYIIVQLCQYQNGKNGSLYLHYLQFKVESKIKMVKL